MKKQLVSIIAAIFIAITPQISLADNEDKDKGKNNSRASSDGGKGRIPVFTSGNRGKYLNKIIVKLNDGNGDLVFTHTIKKSDHKVSDLGKELNSKWFKNNVKDDGKGNWVITQKLGKDFKGDILRDVPQAINYVEEGGTPAVNVLKDGDLMEMYQVKIPTYQIQDPNNLDYEIPVDSKIVNKQLVDDAF